MNTARTRVRSLVPSAGPFHALLLEVLPRERVDVTSVAGCTQALERLDHTFVLTKPVILVRSWIELNLETIRQRTGKEKLKAFEKRLAEADARLYAACRSVVCRFGYRRMRAMHDTFATNLGIPASHWWAYPVRTVRNFGQKEPS